MNSCSPFSLPPSTPHGVSTGAPGPSPPPENDSDKTNAVPSTTMLARGFPPQHSLGSQQPWGLHFVPEKGEEVMVPLLQHLGTQSGLGRRVLPTGLVLGHWPPSDVWPEPPFMATPKGTCWDPRTWTTQNAPRERPCWGGRRALGCAASLTA